MAFTHRAGGQALQPHSRRHSLASNGSAAAPRQRLMGLRSTPSPHLRHIRKVAAVEEQETASEEQPAEAVAAPSPELEAVAQELELEELDEAQEDLLKWMLFLDEEAQQEDLDENVDYDEFGDGEYEEIFEDVETMIEAADYELKPGDKVLGTVYECDEDGAYVEIGAKSAGFVPLSECSLARLKSPLEVLRPGMRREFIVVEPEDEYGEIILSLAALEATTFWQRIRQIQEEDIAVYVTVASVNRGGLAVMYHHLEGFVPVSQCGPSIDMESATELIGYQIPVKFLEVDEEAERLVFSNRRVNSEGDMLGFNIGDVVTGVVQSVRPYGAFVDIGGGATGLLHISQITHERLTAVDQIMMEGDKIKVMILSQDRQRGRVTLSTKKLEPTPGDMLRDPQLVYERAEEMGAKFRERIESADASAIDGEYYAQPSGGAPYAGGYAAPDAAAAQLPPGSQGQFAFDA